MCGESTKQAVIGERESRDEFLQFPDTILIIHKICQQQSDWVMDGQRTAMHTHNAKETHVQVASQKARREFTEKSLQQASNGMRISYVRCEQIDIAL